MTFLPSTVKFSSQNGRKFGSLEEGMGGVGRDDNMRGYWGGVRWWFFLILRQVRVGWQRCCVKFSSIYEFVKGVTQKNARSKLEPPLVS